MKKLYLNIDDEHYEVLCRVARKERRRPNGQAEVLLEEVLDQIGEEYSPTEDGSTAVSLEPAAD